jgi:hypothetical protein
MPENERQSAEPVPRPRTQPHLAIQSNADEEPGRNSEESVLVVTPALFSAINNRYNYTKPISDIPDKLTWERISTAAKWIILKTIADYSGKPVKNFGSRKCRSLVGLLRLTLCVTPTQVHDFMALYMAELEALFEYEQKQKETSWESLTRQAAETNGALLDWLPAKRPDLTMDFVTQKQVTEASVFLWQGNLHELAKDLDRWRGIRADGEFAEIELDLDTVQDTFDSIMLQQAVKVGLINQTTARKLRKSIRYEDLQGLKPRGELTRNTASAQDIFNRDFTGDSEPFGAIKIHTNSSTTLTTKEPSKFSSKATQENFEDAFSTNVEKLSSSFPQPGEGDRILGAYVPFPNATAISPFTTLEHFPGLENFVMPDYRQDHDSRRLQVCRQIRTEQVRITPVNFVPGHTVATHVERNMDSVEAGMPVDLTSANTETVKPRQNPPERQTTGPSMASRSRHLFHRSGVTQDKSPPTSLIRPRYQNLDQNIAQFTGSATDEILHAVRIRPALRVTGNTMITPLVPRARPGVHGRHGAELTQASSPATDADVCYSMQAKNTQPGQATSITNVNNDLLQDSEFRPPQMNRPTDLLPQIYHHANQQPVCTGQHEIMVGSSVPEAIQYQAPEPPVPASIQLRQHLDSHHASRMKSVEPDKPKTTPCTTTKRKRQPSRRLIDNELASSDVATALRSDEDGDYDPSRRTRAASKRKRPLPKKISKGNLNKTERTSVRGQSDGARDSPDLGSETIKTGDDRVIGEARNPVSMTSTLK